MRKYRNIPNVTITGILVIVFYCLLTVISWSIYPDTYGPLTHYLSRLGNYDYNPLGAAYYNLACILTGIALVPFFLEVFLWYREGAKYELLISPAVILGLTSAVALVLIGVYSEDLGSPHMVASSTFFLLNFFVLVFLSIGLLFHPSVPKLLGLFGLVFDISCLLFEVFVGGPLTEWFTVFGSLTIVGLISLAVYRILTQ